LLAYALLNELISAGQLFGFCMVTLAVVLAR
jgi:drug/metabolite transporter (DMT)-like permease